MDSLTFKAPHDLEARRDGFKCGPVTVHVADVDDFGNVTLLIRTERHPQGLQLIVSRSGGIGALRDQQLRAWNGSGFN